MISPKTHKKWTGVLLFTAATFLTNTALAREECRNSSGTWRNNRIHG